MGEISIDNNGMFDYSKVMYEIEPVGENSISAIEERRNLATLFSMIVPLASPEDLAYVNAYLLKKTNSADVESEIFKEYRFLGELRDLPTLKTIKEKWPGGKNTPEDIVSFLHRNYSDFLGYGMTRAHLEKIDHSALVALRVWEKKEKRRWYAMPTTKEHNDAILHWRSQISPDEFNKVFSEYDVRRFDRMSLSRMQKNIRYNWCVDISFWL